MSKFICEFCEKNISTKGNLERHVKICKKNTPKNENKNKTKDMLIKENNELKIKISALETEVKMLKENNEQLKIQSSNQLKDIVDIAKIPKNNNNNIINYKNKLTVPFDLGDNQTINHIQTTLRENIEMKHVRGGQKSLAGLVSDFVLLDQDRKNGKYVCTDASRGMFRFKDNQGNVLFDVNAKKLSSIVYKGVRDKVLQLKDEFIHNDENRDEFALEFINRNITGIMNMINDNNEFKNEIINLSQ